MKSVEDKLSELGVSIEWHQSLFLQWTAQLEAYLNISGPVYLYDDFETEEEEGADADADAGAQAQAQAQAQANSEKPLPLQLVGLGWGPRMGDLVKWPIDVLDCSDIRETESGWFSATPPEEFYGP